MSARFLRRCSVVAILGLILAACGSVATPPANQSTAGPAAAPTAPQGAASGQLPRNATLYVAGFQWGPHTTFNPLNSSPTWPSSGQQELLYETLFAFNLLSGELEPLLAKELTFSDQTTAQITLQDGTTWQDGKPLTPEDVVFSFGLAKSHTDLPYSTFWQYVSEFSSTGERTLQIKLNPDQINPIMVKQFLATVRILPKHIWEAREKSGESLAQFVENEPVGSGPYKVQTFSPERIVLVRDDAYWGKPIYGSVAPQYMIHPIFKSNDDGNLAFQRGEVDLSQQFTPQIWQMWEQKGLPVGTWYKQEPYYVPGSIPMLMINVHKPGLDNPKVRLALAYSINYPQIAATAMSRYSIPVKSSLIIPVGSEEKFFNAQQVADLGWSYNPDKAKQILEQELGAKQGSDGIYVLPDGTRLGPYKAQTPYGWTDWMTAIDLVSQSAKAVGIDVSSEFPDQPVVNTKIRNGDFDLTLWFVAGATPASPWQRFRDVLDDRGVPDFGQQAFWNYGRFKNPDVPVLLDRAAATTDPELQKGYYSALDKIFIENIPTIPLMYRPLEFYEYNETVWTGFPNADNPTAPPMHQQAGIKLYYQLKAK
jgi:peptide/nickel transport system substrate-binding protein